MDGIIPQQQFDSEKRFVSPKTGEAITSLKTNNTYVIGEKIGEGYFGIVFACKDVWERACSESLLKPNGSYEEVKNAAIEELKLTHLRHPNITYIYDAFEYQNTFTSLQNGVTSIEDLFSLKGFDGKVWLIPITRTLLQAVKFIHLNQFVHQDIHLGNIFTAMVNSEMARSEPASTIKFKLGDLGVTKLLQDLRVNNTRAQWMLLPECLNSEKFGPLDHRIDIYHLGLIFLQLAYSQKLTFSEQEIIDGKPRKMAESLSEPYNFAISKALRRRVIFRTNDALELWRDLNSISAAS